MALPFQPGPPGGPPGMPFLPPPLPPLALLQMLPPEMLRRDNLGIPIPPDRQAQPTRQLDDSRVLAMIEEAKDFWSPRDDRMDEDEDLYRMAESSSDVIVRNTIYVAVEKVTNMIASQEPVIQKVVPHPSLSKQAQMVENALYHAWRQWDRRWRRAGYHSLLQDEVHDLARRGWLAVRVQYDPQAGGDQVPVTVELVDPRNVYPMYSGDDLAYVIHWQSITVAEARKRYPEAEQLFAEREDKEYVELKAYYDATYHAVYLDDVPVKPIQPHGYPFIPWWITTASGPPSRGTNRTQGSNEWTRDIGPSFFHSIKNAHKRRNELYSQLSDIVKRASNPPLVVRKKPGTDDIETVSLEPGAINYILPDENIDVMETRPSPTEVGPLLAALDEDIQLGTLSPVLWGGGNAGISGFAVSLLSGAARDALFGIIRAIEATHEEINRMALTILRDMHTAPVGIVVKDPAGNWVGGEVVTPQQIAQVGVETVVRFRDVSPQDRYQMAQLAIALTRDQLISRETAREEYLNIADPGREDHRIIKELMYQDPEFMRLIMVPYSIYQNSPNELFPLWMALQRGQMMQAQSMLGALAGAPGGPSPVGGVPGVPGGPGVPPTVAPAQMGPNLVDLLAQVAGGSAGGAGERRREGVSGAGGLLPGGAGVR